jgi:hypothetical protein
MKKTFLLAVVLILTLFSSRVFSFSGDITYSGTEAGTIYVVYSSVSGSFCTDFDWASATWIPVGGAPYPVSYDISGLPAGNYCVGAYLDASPTGFPPGVNDPIGVYASFTSVASNATDVDIPLDDQGNFAGTWALTVDVAVPGQGGCQYLGSVTAYNIQNDLFGFGPITTATGSVCPPFLNIGFLCDTSPYPPNPIYCVIIGPPPGTTTYISQGTVTNNGNTVNGSFMGSYQATAYSAEWTLNKNKPVSSIPTLTQWGMIIFVVLAGFGAAYYLRRQKRAKS